MRKWLMLIGVVAGVLATGSIFRSKVTIGERDEVYPFSVIEGEPTPELKRTASNLEMVVRALVAYRSIYNRHPGNMEEFLRGPFGAWMILNNPYQGRPVRLLDEKTAPDAAVDNYGKNRMAVPPEFYGDIAIIPYPHQEGALELRAYVPPLKDGRSYLFDLLSPPISPSSGIRPLKEILRRQAIFESLSKEEQQVNVYCTVLWVSATEVGRVIIRGIRDSFKPPLSFAELREAWWAVNPDNIRNPYTGRPIREVPLDKPEPGEVTLLPAEIGAPVPEFDYQGPPSLRPATRPVMSVAIGYNADRKAVDWATFLLAVNTRPRNLPPIPEEIINRLRPVETGTR